MAGFILLLLLFQNFIDINTSNSNSSGNNTIKNENAGYDNRFEHKNDFDIEKINSINTNTIRKRLLGKLLDTNVSIHEKQNVLDECIANYMINNSNRILSLDLTAGNLFKDFDFEFDFEDGV
jgi:hypothetical protein